MKTPRPGGLAQYVALAAVEKARGRDAAVAEMGKLLVGLALAEPGSADDPGQPLIAARDEMFYRRKAAAVWWMLRDIAGDTAWREAVNAMRVKPLGMQNPREQALAFETALESAAHMDLKWFFADWVLADTGLPDLEIADVTPRPLPAGQGHDSGWLVAVTVRNSGRCAAEVPLVLRSGTFSTTRHLRVAGMSTVTERVVLQTAPTELVLNDGTVPEQRTSRHVRTLNVVGK